MAATRALVSRSEESSDTTGPGQQGQPASPRVGEDHPGDDYILPVVHMRVQRVNTNARWG
jgi:hypothetical protein